MLRYILKVQLPECCWIRYKIRETTLRGNIKSLVLGVLTLGFLLDMRLEQAIGYLSPELKEVGA